MGHCVSHNIDAERVGFFDRELLEVPRVLTFSLPTVTQVGIVANEDHDSIRVVSDRLINGFARVGGSWFPNDT